MKIIILTRKEQMAALIAVRKQLDQMHPAKVSKEAIDILTSAKEKLS